MSVSYKRYKCRVITKDMEESINNLRRMVLEDVQLSNFRTDNAYLLRYLHCTDFNVEEAFSRMKNFCDLLLQHPDWFASTSPLEKRKQFDLQVKAMLMERDRFGRRVYLSKLGCIDTSITYPQEQAQIDEMWFELVIDEPETQEKGISIIIDMKGFSWKLFCWLTPLNVKISTNKIDLYPCKEIIYHVVNTSLLLNASIKITWPFLSSKIKERIKFHFEDWPSLHEYFDPAILPKEYGGTGPDIDFIKLNQCMYDKAADIEEKLKYQRICN